MGDEFVQVIAEGTISGEGILVEQPLGAAVEPTLTVIARVADRPAHLAVPAASERHHGHARQAGCHGSGRPPPVGFLKFFGLSLLECVVHHISRDCFLGVLLNHRTNRGGAQNLKGRTSAILISEPSVAASQSTSRTCTKGPLHDPPKDYYAWKFEFWLSFAGESRPATCTREVGRLNQERQ